MPDLYMLRRSDNGLLQVASGSDAAARAERLSEDHAFDVTVAAVLPLMGHRLQNVEWHLGSPPLKGNWHDCSLSVALSAIAAAVDDDGGSLEPALEPYIETGIEPPCLEDFLEPCNNVEATKVRDVTEASSVHMSKSEMQAMLRDLRQVVLPDAGGRKRRVWKDSAGRSLRLRA
jgi:hypothetical protein